MSELCRQWPDEIDCPMRDKTDRSLFSDKCRHGKSSAATRFDPTFLLQQVVSFLSGARHAICIIALGVVARL
jgi:hypothetical protein